MMDQPPRRHSSHRGSLAGIVIAFVLIAASCGGGSGETDGPDAATTPTALPATALASFADGRSVTLNDFVGKPLVVNFWASWCPSCVAEMSAAFRPVQDQLGDSVTFLGVNIQDDRDNALELLDETGVEWISVENQDGSLWSELGGLAMPFTVFISETGEIVDRHNGPLDETLLLERIQETLLG